MFLYMGCVCILVYACTHTYILVHLCVVCVCILFFITRTELSEGKHAAFLNEII